MFFKKKSHYLIFHTRRCGSKLLGDLIGQHPRCCWDGELFVGPSAWAAKQSTVMLMQPSHIWCESEHFPDQPYEYIKDRMREAKQFSHYGFDLTPDQLRSNHLQLPVFIKQMNQLGADKMVLLKRNNYLRQLVSFMIARETGQWHLSPSESASLAQLRLDPDRVIMVDKLPLLECFKRLDNEYLALEEAFAGQNVLRLSYEEDIADDPMVAYRRVCEFIKVKPARPEVTFSRTNPQPLRSIVTNFDEISDRLRQTQYAWMLDA